MFGDGDCCIGRDGVCVGVKFFFWVGDCDI